LIAFSDRLAEFRSLGAEVVGFSTDSHHTHLAWINTPRSEGGVGNMAYPLIADISKEMSRAYGVLVEDRTDDMFGAALRGLFVIDPKGVVRSVTINDDSVGRNVDETLRIVKAFQHADAHGVVCPANWQPGEATIVPDQTAKMTFFHDSYPSKK
jgi:peroxiredoxin (alkyl hydroperoxide reductase subunit C)